MRARDMHGRPELEPRTASAVVLFAFGVFVVTRRPYPADRAAEESEG